MLTTRVVKLGSCGLVGGSCEWRVVLMRGSYELLRVNINPLCFVVVSGGD